MNVYLLANLLVFVSVMTDSGWEGSETEVNLIYYNEATKVLMLTRKYGNYKTYEESDDWKLVWQHPEISIERRLSPSKGSCLLYFFKGGTK